MTDRPILARIPASSPHWVGDGFLTRSMLPPGPYLQETSPFLIAGYNPAMEFPPSAKPRGVGMHPHRGFETVTIVFQGGLVHGDTMGNRGEIGPGDVQWMTAASGVQHEEFHAPALSQQGGVLEMMQLWVNLPAAHKGDAPRYQTLAAAEIPQIALPDGGSLRVIAGSYGDLPGAAETVSPLQLWDMRLPAGGAHSLDLPADWTVSVLLLSGRMSLNGVDLSGPETVIFATAPGAISLRAEEDAHCLILAGEPLGEPVAMGGPFVMNTQTELRQAWDDYRGGRF